MEKRYFTLFILKNDASKARQIRIPISFCKTAGAVTAIFFLVFSFVIYDYTRIKLKTMELFSLKKENIDQKIELQSFASKIKDLEAELARLSLFDKKLRIIANIDEPKASGPSAQDQIKGLGGESSPEEEYLSSTPKAKVNELVSQMSSDLRNLEDRARTQENSFTELQDALMKKTSFLASTPSIWPVRGWVTSTFGQRISPFTGFQQMHKGIDIANRLGTNVVAPASGIVVQSGGDAGLGKVLVISHGYGVKTTYGHLSEIFVRVGQRVRRGDKIAAMGNTGHSTGPHLHYEVSLNGISVNPTKYILN